MNAAPGIADRLLALEAAVAALQVQVAAGGSSPTAEPSDLDRLAQQLGNARLAALDATLSASEGLLDQAGQRPAPTLGLSSEDLLGITAPPLGNSLSSGLLGSSISSRGGGVEGDLELGIGRGLVPVVALKGAWLFFVCGAPGGAFAAAGWRLGCGWHEEGPYNTVRRG